jgi:hypothetical protein
MDQPADYIIRVLGALDEEWSDRLGGMSVRVDRSDTDRPVTTLTGRLPDQAALTGVIEAVCQLHLRVLEVRCLDEQTK